MHCGEQIIECLVNGTKYSIKNHQITKYRRGGKMPIYDKGGKLVIQVNQVPF